MRHGTSTPGARLRSCSRHLLPGLVGQYRSEPSPGCGMLN